ncbi:GNAT family N-acetyltransferase [Bradyrhizobium sp. JYMT SZCCT0428]|uniref:GNAT family N-acetyltransferase n=1 Tax=Bradyrhizobium sp. JYMT SZCCT0428 TaxID=2807673 RepID=UPI0039089E73
MADTLLELHRLTFLDCAPIPKFDHGHWWLARDETEPVGFAGVVPSTHVSNAGYFCRVGVLRKHWGRRLQLRLMAPWRGVRGSTDGARSFPTRLTICRLPIISFAPATGCFSRRSHGLGRIRFIGASSLDSQRPAFFRSTPRPVA